MYSPPGPIVAITPAGLQWKRATPQGRVIFRYYSSSRVFSRWLWLFSTRALYNPATPAGEA